MLEQVLSGFNCTIFAYGQTGTGKTYTMSGDISDKLPLPDDAGIIPRVLHALFARLDGAGADCAAENSVKVSFIELYNEELRDLLSADDTVKLRMYEDNNKQSKSGGHSGATLVQGMEEAHIMSASKGIRLLREGSHKRQVAATKCNDLSSRSHTVFTITVFIKRTSQTGEDYVSAGKLNLVDLAGSENIQRSGAKNIRNKPQVNAAVPKKTLLKEYTSVIEKLKSELVATRQRNGVYLPQESYDEMVTEKESRRILTEEMRDKIETMEINLRNKVQELFNLTTSFTGLKKESDMTKMMLDGTKSILEKTEKVLEHTKKSLAEEEALRKAHQRTEQKLADIGIDL